jgi:bifunctional DNA-binding transcriptional regulator/antitoxin component of YhaV-PrlF toxin-antitoxin module
MSRLMDTSEIVQVQVDEEGAFVPIPEKFLKMLGWEEGDEVNVEFTHDCADDKDTVSIILSNPSRIVDTYTEG